MEDGSILLEFRIYLAFLNIIRERQNLEVFQSMMKILKLCLGGNTEYLFFTSKIVFNAA
jgi:hypothetical protein